MTTTVLNTYICLFDRKILAEAWSNYGSVRTHAQFLPRGRSNRAENKHPGMVGLSKFNYRYSRLYFRKLTTNHVSRRLGQALELPRRKFK